MAKVIAIDDDELILAYYDALFDDIKCFSAVADAEEYLEFNQADVIILDFHMPDTKRKVPEIIDSLKSEAPILICSGVEDARVQEVCLKHGATSFLFKNGDSVKLVKRVNALAGD